MNTDTTTLAPTQRRQRRPCRTCQLACDRCGRTGRTLLRVELLVGAEAFVEVRLCQQCVGYYAGDPQLPPPHAAEEVTT